MFPAFPKIFALGNFMAERLFTGPVEITEKVDGSQFAFGWDDKGVFYMRSKGAVIIEDRPPKLFKGAHDFALDARDNRIDPFNHNYKDLVFYGETLQNPRHNILSYSRVPAGNFVLFGARTGDQWADYAGLLRWQESLHCDVVPLLWAGTREGISIEELKELLRRESFLGGPRIEGVVFKNYTQAVDWKGLYLPLTAAKFVSEEFKEVHAKDWSGLHTDKGKFELLRESYRTEARWAKAVQHLRDAGKLQTAPQDIGPLIAEVKRDLVEEEREIILQKLWQIYGDDILKRAVAGLPEWYKLKLVEDIDANRQTEI